MSIDRRSLLKGLAAAGAGAAATAAVPVEASAKAVAPADAYGMLYDATRCIGCKSCVVACKQANDMPPETATFADGLWDAPIDLSGKTRNIIKLYKGDGEQSFIKAQCMHCIDPACARACMIGAYRKREHGIVTWDGSRCIGCRYCQVACPYEIPKFQWDTATPKMVKCEMCNHLIAVGKQPGCCAVCPAKAVIFGKYEDLLADARQRLADHPDRYVPKIYGEHDGGGTQVLYLAGVDFHKLGLPELSDEPAGEIAQKVQHTAYKGFIAPVVLYGVLGAVLWRNRRSAGKEDQP